MESKDWMIYYELNDQRLKDINNYDDTIPQKKDMEF